MGWIDRIYEGLLKLIIDGSVEGKDHRGRPRLEYNQQLIRDQGCDSYVQMKRKADNREERKLTVNQFSDWNHSERERCAYCLFHE